VKILSAAQIREADHFTIEKENIASIDLMERASEAFCKKFETLFQSPTLKIFCGIGNNGGDGLAIARILKEKNYSIEIFIAGDINYATKDFQINLQRVKRECDCPVNYLSAHSRFPKIEKNDLVIDALFGIGLNRPIEGWLKDLIKHINSFNGEIIAVDVPSGFFADSSTTGKCIHATTTISFQLPKLMFLFPQSYDCVGEFHFVDIGLSSEYVEQAKVKEFFTDEEMIRNIYRPRKKFANKGTYGHAILIGGEKGKSGAIWMSSLACARAGSGLVSMQLLDKTQQSSQPEFPELMIWNAKDDLKKINAIGIGCGLGTSAQSEKTFEDYLQKFKSPMVIDADAINLLSQNKNLVEKIPKQSILTPHVKEFERLAGDSKDDFEQWQKQKIFSEKNKIFVVLKGAHTCITTPDGESYFNSTGNPGMATGGSGDVLTGIITGLLAQHYSPLESCLLGVYIHGFAGNIAAEKLSEEAMIASDIIDSLGEAFKKIKSGN
jgi:ADP-dependent NAD(P)H-hydrate dehydratase / NAD(P)H-hydrate epimerase